MPGENREDQINHSSLGLPDDTRQGSLSSSPRRSSNTMIPLPRSTKFVSSTNTLNPKTVKTKRNRLRLIMENKEAFDAIEKEDQEDRSYDDRFRRTSTTLRYSKVTRDTYRTSDCKEDVEVIASKKTWGLFPEENQEGSGGGGGVIRVGERGGLIGDPHRSYERFELEDCVGSSGLGSSSSSSSSSNNLASSRYNQQSVRRPIRIFERGSTALVYPVVVAAHEPETSCSRRPAALAVPAVPVVAAPTTTTTTTTTAATTATTAAAAAAAVRSVAAAKNLLIDATDADLRGSTYLSSSFIKDTKKEDAMEPEIKEEDERRSSASSPEFYVRRNKCYNEDGSSEEENKPGCSLQSHGLLPSSYSGTWPIRRDLWATQQMGFSNQQSTSSSTHNDVASVMSFSSNSGTMLGTSTEMQGHRRLGAKVDVVYNLLSMLGSSEGREDMSSTLLSMSTSIDSCLVMRQSGCLPLLVQLIHAPGQDPETRERASRALHNVVHAKSDERAGRREARVLRFLEQLRDYCQSLRTSLESGQAPDLEKHPGATIAGLMKLSFDEAHRHAMCQLGGLHAVAELIEMDHLAHGSECDDQNCITLRRYAGMALTNLTFGDGNNKALLCSFREFMKALVSQLRSPSDDLRQVTASVLRNLSWRADSSSKQTLREVGAVTGLMKAAMEGRKESTLKSILSALWNLSAHCSTNKVDICAVDGALAFLVDMLSYNAPSKTLAIVENAGGILRNVSCHVAVREDYRAIVRERGCLQVLLQQLRSPSLTVVSNACGALWNLSARCPQDQRLLWSLGAVPMLRSLVHSKHKMISMGSSAALKNLLNARPGCSNIVQLDSTARGLGLPTLPFLAARRQRALEQEIDQNLAETCDNIEPSTSPTNKDDKFTFKVDHSFLSVNNRGLRSYQLYNQSSTSGTNKCNGVSRSESRESMRSVTSTHSDTMFERVHRHVLNGMSPTETQGKQSLSLHAATGFDNGIQMDNPKATSSEKKYTLRYKNAIPENLRPNDIEFSNVSELRSTTSTISWSSVPDQEAVCSQTLLHSSVEDNASLLNQSMSSTSKFNSQSSVSDETDVTVCKNSEYRSDIPKSKSDIPSQLSYVPDNFSSNQCEDYDRMYTDNSLLHQCDPLNSIQNAISPTLSHNSEESLFRNYAETDLDQPTDYSIRYAEQTVEDDEKQHAAYYVTTEQGLIQEDTIKMYCTEGTPRGISLNSSRAASSSDLQEDSKIKSLSRKLLEPNKLNDIEHNEKASSLMNIEKANNRFTNQDKKQDFDIASKFIEKKWQESVPGSCQYNKDNSTKVNSTEVKTDKHEIPINQSITFDTESKSSKELFLNKGTSYVGNIDQASDVDEDDEDLLAACINIGMQNNRHRHSFIGNSFEKLPRAESNLMRYQTSIALDQVESNDSIGSATDSFNPIQPEPTGKALPINTLREHSSVLLDTTKSFKDDLLITKEDQTELAEELNDKEKSMASQNIQKHSSNSNISEISVTDNDNFSVHTIPSTIDITLSSKETSTSNIEYSLQDKLEFSNEHCKTFKIDLCSSKDLKVTESTKWKEKLLKETEIIENMCETRMKSTDSESSNSIDSVEQSEHALLELCIQTGLPNASENIAGKRSTIIKHQKLNDESYTHLKASFKDNEINDNITKDDVDEKETYVIDKTTKRVEEDVYRRQRDPDAMIASLDRLTATLVQQTEAIRERDSNTMKQSILSDTWNEDSPNEVSFPSISISAPIVPSFKSDVPDGQTTIMSDIAEGEDDEHVNMTDSKIIQQEAIKLAEAVDAEVNKQNEMETTSMTSIDLDAIKPPSSMGSLLSLTASYAGPTDNTESYVNRDRCYSTSLPPVQTKNQSGVDSRNCRKKSLPLGVVAKRALNQGQSHTGSLENLLNDCVHSHLENVKPPSVMDELFDVGDMENSMLSVASITSEVADNKDHDSHSLSGSDPVFDLLKPVANVLSITCMRYAEGMQSSGNNSLSEYLENINPPSLFNEVNEMDQSTMEGNTDTLCNDTLCIDTELRTEEVPPTLVEAIDEGENDTDEGITTISSEYCVSSSAESTPKKRSNKNHLTPKQKRNLAKERYKTYTIAAEFVKKEEERRKQEGKPVETPNKITQGKCSPFSKLTPKQRRQEDRARFQTQVLENPFPIINAIVSNKEEIDQTCQQKDPEVVDPATAGKSSIPTLTKLPMPRALRKKRAENQENKERYRTRTLNDSECMQKVDDCDIDPTANTLEKEGTDNVHNIALEEINNMLEHNATIVLNTLNESSKAHAVSLGDDVLLDQETLSLVSNESGSEQSLRLCFVNGVSKRLMDTYTNQADISQRYDHNVQEEKDKSDVERAPEENDPIESGSDNGSNCTEEQCQVIKRPRIIKPGMGSSRDVSADSNTTDKSEPGSPKAIRGRRKALYSNPITRKPTPQSSPLKHPTPVSAIPIGRSNTSPIVRTTRAIALRQSNSPGVTPPTTTKEPTLKTNTSPKISSAIANYENKIKNANAASKRTSLPNKGSSLTFTRSNKRHSTPACSSSSQNESKVEVPTKQLERQGTFTKDEPEVENAPTVFSPASPIKTKIAKPIKGTTKIHPAVGKSKISVRSHQTYQTKGVKANGIEKPQVSKIMPTLGIPKSGTKVTGTSKGLTNNQSTLQNDNGKVFRKIGPLGQRSNSNSSIISDTSSGVQNRRLAKEATSKIASLWKKVEENKSKQLSDKSDGKKWITPGNGTAEIDGQIISSKPPAFRLFRSSTFEGVPQDDSHKVSMQKSRSKQPLITNVQANGVKYRNSCDLSGMNANEAPCKIPVKSSNPVTSKKDNIVQGDNTVILRRQQGSDAGNEIDSIKRMSRLGSFITVDPPNSDIAQIPIMSGNGRVPASAIVPPFNYNPKADIPSHIVKGKSDDSEGKFEITDSQTEIVTASSRVTTV